MELEEFNSKNVLKFKRSINSHSNSNPDLFKDLEINVVATPIHPNTKIEIFDQDHNSQNEIICASSKRPFNLKARNTDSEKEDFNKNFRNDDIIYPVSGTLKHRGPSQNTNSNNQSSLINVLNENISGSPITHLEQQAPFNNDELTLPENQKTLKNNLFSSFFSPSDQSNTNSKRKMKLERVGGQTYTNALNNFNPSDILDIENDIRNDVQYSMLIKNLNSNSLPKVIDMLVKSRRNSPTQSVKNYELPTFNNNQTKPNASINDHNIEHNRSLNNNNSKKPEIYHKDFSHNPTSNKKYISTNNINNITNKNLGNYTTFSAPYPLDKSNSNSPNIIYSSDSYSPKNFQSPANKYTYEKSHSQKSSAQFNYLERSISKDNLYGINSFYNISNDTHNNSPNDDFGTNISHQHSRNVSNFDTLSLNESFSANEIMKQHFLVKIGQAMGEYGCPTYRLEIDLYRMANFLNIKANFAILPGLFITFFGDKNMYNNETKIVKLTQSFDMYKLELVSAVLEDVLQNDELVEDGLRQLPIIKNMKPIYSNYVQLFAYGICSLAACPLAFNGGVIDMVVSFFLSLFVYLFESLGRKYKEFSNLVEFISAVFVGFVATFLHKHICFGSVVLSSLVIPLPGFLMTTGRSAQYGHIDVRVACSKAVLDLVLPASAASYPHPFEFAREADAHLAGLLEHNVWRFFSRQICVETQLACCLFSGACARHGVEHIGQSFRHSVVRVHLALGHDLGPWIHRRSRRERYELGLRYADNVPVNYGGAVPLLVPSLSNKKIEIVENFILRLMLVF
ncbi:Pheromone-regulated membrane protein 10 [Smittium culicis]|uniref:Pheromone-regulated membrane protein 10 n=1 Tax=Smittium culicis TaxID=133412 RepID=A0A1R1YMW5_9FUNG|nr:Pheromone-regulated membrane protein 10 [Smittium culicis]